MAVKNASNFSLLDVINEIDPRNRSLVGCISDADRDGWVSSYRGSEDRLSNFRGYNHTPGSY
mgnify:CR=1 FL=1